MQNSEKIISSTFSVSNRPVICPNCSACNAARHTNRRPTSVREHPIAASSERGSHHRQLQQSERGQTETYRYPEFLCRDDHIRWRVQDLQEARRVQPEGMKSEREIGGG
eukprot:m.224009 g.224009  ORF g.224009 m.224009 type:complete len:109 (-) comp25865_c2_seq7:1885-2211(-)